MKARATGVSQGLRLRAGQRGFLKPRDFAVLAVLAALLTVPLWWKKDKPKASRSAAQASASAAASNPVVTTTVAAAITPTTSTVTATVPDPAAAASAPSAAPNAPASAPAAPLAFNPGRFALTLGHTPVPSKPDLMYSSCNGEPKDMGNPSSSQCNPQQGDMSCRTALPVLCILKDGSTAESAGLTAESAGLAANWVGGSLGATTPVAGFVLGSRPEADARCAKELGTGWRMAEFGDASGAGNLIGKRGLGLTNTNTRHWVAINDQKSNCWDPN